MTTTDILIVVFSGICGAGALLCAYMSFFINHHVKKIEKNGEKLLELQTVKQTEAVVPAIASVPAAPVSNNSKKTMISKSKFDTIYRMYREVSDKNLEMVASGSHLTFSFKPDIKKEEMDEKWSSFKEKYNIASQAVRRYAPFIEKDIYEMYIELLEECDRQLTYYIRWRDEEDYSYSSKKSEYYETILEQQKEIIAVSAEVVERLRVYLESLDVNE